MVLLCLQNYHTQRMDYFEYNRGLYKLDGLQEKNAIRTMNRFPCDDLASADGISIRQYALFGKLSFKLPLEQKVEGSTRTRLVMGVVGMFDRNVRWSVRDLLRFQGVSVREGLLDCLCERIKRLQLVILLTGVGLACVAIAGVIAISA